MKRYAVALFVISVLALVVACWYFFPSDGIKTRGMTFRFPSYEAYLQDLRDGKGPDVDSAIQAARRAFELMQESDDTLGFFKDYFTSDPNRIFLPDSGYSYFDSLFVEMEHAGAEGRVLRVTWQTQDFRTQQKQAHIGYQALPKSKE